MWSDLKRIQISLAPRSLHLKEKVKCTPRDCRALIWSDTLKANEHLVLATPEARAGRGGKEKSSPRAFREHGPADTFILDLWPPDYERINVCCFKVRKKCYFINTG